VRPAFTELRPDLQGKMDVWFDRALQADPFWRFGSAKELFDGLENAARPVARSANQAARITLREAA
jgi:hypothetical protein